MSYSTLEEYLNAGWSVHFRGVMEIDSAPISKDKVEKLNSDTEGKASHIVFLHRSGESKFFIYPICDSHELELANNEVKKGWEIIAYEVKITCRGKSIDHGEINSDLIAEKLSPVIEGDINVNDKENYFDISKTIEGDDFSHGYGFIENVKSALLAMSLKNQIGVEIINIGWSKSYAAQPVFIWASKVKPKIVDIDSNDIEEVEKLKDEWEEKILLDIVTFYGQISEGGKLITGFSLLENLFDEDPEHILSEAEQKHIIENIINDVELKLEQKKIDKLKEILKNPNFLARYNRNQRISKNIAELLQEDEETIYKQIKKISKLRAKPAHSIVKELEGFYTAVEFIERVLHNYFNNK